MADASTDLGRLDMIIVSVIFIDQSDPSVALISMDLLVDRGLDCGSILRSHFQKIGTGGKNSRTKSQTSTA